MILDDRLYKSQLKAKTFIFRVGSYNNVGGAETKAITLAEILKDEIGANVIFLASGGDGQLKNILQRKGFRTETFYYHLNAPRFKKIKQIIRQILFLRKLKPDFILPWSSDNCKSVLPFWRYTGAKYAWWNMQDEGRGLYKTKNEEKLLNEATDIISNSIAGKEFIEKNYTINGKPIILYNNPTPIPDKANLKPIWREKLGIENETLLVSMFANITRFKDHFTLFKAWRNVLDHFEPKGQKLKLVLAGDCRETTNELKILGFDLDIAHAVIFLGSVLEVNELMNESDLVVHSSNTEGCPNAVCEAMALEKPVVGTDIPGCREALTDKYEDFTLSIPNNPEDLAKKIIHMLEEKQKAQKIATFNKHHIEEEYTLENMVNTLFPLFLKVI